MSVVVTVTLHLRFYNIFVRIHRPRAEHSLHRSPLAEVAAPVELSARFSGARGRVSAVRHASGRRPRNGGRARTHALRSGGGRGDGGDLGRPSRLRVPPGSTNPLPTTPDGRAPCEIPPPPMNTGRRFINVAMWFSAQPNNCVDLLMNIRKG